jgi:hypothetical protein
VGTCLGDRLLGDQDRVDDAWREVSCASRKNPAGLRGEPGLTTQYSNGVS